MPLEDKTPLLCDSASTPPPCSPAVAPVVAILGSGDFARSLAIRLVDSGVGVVVGSRDPTRVASGRFPVGVQLCMQREAVCCAVEVVFAALNPEHYSTLGGLRDVLAGKVLVDVSNAIKLNGGEPSNAERLAERFPESRVVKAFNVISAWTLQNRANRGNRQVLVCSDCPGSKSSVMQLAQGMGLLPVDMGGLAAARHVEDVPMYLFPSWAGPLLTTLLLFLLFYSYNSVRSVLLPYILHGTNNVYQLSFEMMNKTLPVVALVILALVYLPGLWAAILQLARGTKYERFPGCLERWMGSRKQLGLLGFLCAGLHAVFVMCQKLRRGASSRLLTADLQVSDDVETSLMEPAPWRSDLCITCGILGFGVLTLLAITALPSVGNTLNWREFTFVQSGLGYAALTVCVMHVLFFGWDFAFHSFAYPFYMPPVYLLALLLPCLVLVGRVLLALPCLSSRLAKIRRGWESPGHRSLQARERLANGVLPQDLCDV